MKLIGSAASPYVRKVRVVLAEKKLEAPLAMEQVWSADTAIARYNPLGKVPCLLLEGGEAIYDSRVIVEYLDTLSPVGKLIPASGRERAEIKTWEALADGVLDAAVLIRLESAFEGRSEAQRSPAWVARQQAKVDRGLDALAHGLGDKPYCAGIHLTLADLAVGCALLWLDYRFPDLGWRARHANLARLADKLAARQSFVDTQPPPL
ncbi:MAG: glutathione S-transferase N-terminal domain-containing protein [Xylophilus ampelinus]